MLEEMPKTEKIPLVAVVGPTASGKSRLAVALAREKNGEILSCDSMQIYKELSVATAKPTQKEMDGIPHHLIDFLPVGEEFSLCEYLNQAKSRIGEILQRGNLPIVCGGTGLYFSSLLDDVKLSDEERDPVLRQSFETKSSDELHEMLRAVDFESAEKLHPNNRGRIIRALEVYHKTGIPISEHQKRSKLHPSPYHAAVIGLDFKDRAKLYERIELRVDAMLKDGLVEEVGSVWEGPVSKTASQAIGYKELVLYLEGRLSLQEAVALIKQETRRYAKRQLTWFRRDKRIHWIYLDDGSFDEINRKALEILTEYGL